MGWGNLNRIDRATEASGVQIAKDLGMVNPDSYRKIWIRDGGQVSLQFSVLRIMGRWRYFSRRIPCLADLLVLRCSHSSTRAIRRTGNPRIDTGPLGCSLFALGLQPPNPPCDLGRSRMLVHHGALSSEE